MNEVFDIKRFGKLLSYDFRVNRWEYLLLLPISILALWLVMFLSVGNISGWIFPEHKYIPIYIMGYLILGIFLNSKSFGALKNRLRATSYLTLPASAFEKFILHWFLRIVLFSLLYPLVFYVGANSFISIFEVGGKIYLDYKGSTAAVSEIIPFKFNMVSPDTGRLFGNFAIYFGPIFALTLVQLGSIAFGKWNIVKTLLSLVGLLTLGYLTIRMIGNIKGGLEELRPNFFINGLPDQITMIEIGLMAFMLITLLVGWAATFIKLKEREV